MSDDEMRAESADDDAYNNTHRAFLQAFLARSVMTVDDIKPVLSAIWTQHNPNRPILIGDITPPDITNFIEQINVRLQPLEYEIRSTRSQTTGTIIYSFINTTSDSLTHLATTFSHEEIAYIKRLLDYMFESNNTRSREIMAVSGIQSSQLAKAPRRDRQSTVTVNGEGDEEQEAAAAAVKGLTMHESEKVLSQLIEQQFLEKSSRGYFSLAPRALMELRTYLKETYNDPGDEDHEPMVRIKDCEGCRQIVTVGVRCADKGCSIRFHDQCAASYFRNQRGRSKVCPTCKAEWTGNLFVGERAVHQGERISEAGMNGVASSSRQSRGRRTIGGDDEDDFE